MYSEQIKKDIACKAGSFKIEGYTNEDLEQEMKMLLWEKRGYFDDSKASYRTWANKVMENHLKDLARKAEKEYVDDNGLKRRRVVYTDNLEAIERSQRKENYYSNPLEQPIDGRLEDLPKQQEKVARLKISKGLTLKEIADKMDLEIGTVRRYWNIIKRKLR